MDSTPTFDIKVALVGYVSVGKTTLLNALFRDKYGEVAMRRATASVNQYCVSTKRSGASNVATAAKEVLQQTVQDNARLRTSDVVEEAWFDIELDHDICEMREDSRLVLVDIPGINEAGTSSKYKDYVTNQWHTFDCVVIVMDGRQGVNTDEQVELLKLAKANCDAIKSVPIIVLCNKIDDPDEEEQLLLVNEAREAVQEIYQTQDQVKTLEQVVEAQRSFPDRGNANGPKAVVVPVSAVHAFIYQARTRVDFDEFKRFDNDHIEKIGKDNFGMKWRRLNKETKLENAFKVVTNSTLCREGYELSNFGKFDAVLAFFIGGKDTQANLLKRQIDTSLSRLSLNQGIIVADELRAMYTRSKVLKLPTDEIPKKAWVLFENKCRESLDSFKTPADVHLLADSMHQLFKYVQFVMEVGWLEEAKLALEKAKLVIHEQALTIMNVFDRADQVDPPNLVLVYGSFLLQSNESFFYKHFGLLKILLEDRARNASANGKAKTCTCNGTPRRLFGNCSVCNTKHSFTQNNLPEYNIVDGVLLPKDGSPSLLSVPVSLEDPNHFGHLIWKFGQILEACQGKA